MSSDDISLGTGPIDKAVNVKDAATIVMDQPQRKEPTGGEAPKIRESKHVRNDDQNVPADNRTEKSIPGGSDSSEDGPVRHVPGAPCVTVAPDASRKASSADFELLKVIGMGAFGKVIQVRSHRNGQVLAMKCISKQMLARRNHWAYMQAERDIMTKCAFQTDHKLFLVMEYLPGGELFYHLSKKGLLLEEYAKFYAAEMVLAVEHLHSKGIIHRDLKPENLLLSAEGHIRVTDFGLAKELTHAEDEGLRTICGTNEYMAPEMILRKGYGKAVDWWSMGALIYEMTSGYPPFKAKTTKELNRKILSEKVSLPKWLSSTAHQVLRGFLERNVSRRLGARKTTMFDIGGAAAVKHHLFFEGIDWAKLYMLQVEPPLKPDLISSTDTSNFCPEFVEMSIPKSLSEDSVLSEPSCARLNDADKELRMFRGFSYVADSFVDSEGMHLKKMNADGKPAGDLNSSGQSGSTPEVTENSGGDADAPLPVRAKKVKGRRVRNKKGKRVAEQGTTVEEIKQPANATVEVQANELRGSSELPGSSPNEHPARFLGVVSSSHSKGSGLNAKKAISSAHESACVERKSKPSGLAAMLAKQEEIPLADPSRAIGAHRVNVWGVRELPAPAPVPTPATGTSRAHPLSSRETRAVISRRKPPAAGMFPLPGRKLDGDKFAWKQPV